MRGVLRSRHRGVAGALCTRLRNVVPSRVGDNDVVLLRLHTLNSGAHIALLL